MTKNVSIPAPHFKMPYEMSWIRRYLTFEKSSFVDRMNGLPVSQQLLLAERIAETKETIHSKKEGCD